MSKPTIAFFGATGGCTLACLVLALRAGYTCTALARTPSKLQTLLAEAGIAPETQEAYLTITHGNATDPAAVRRTLLLRSWEGTAAAVDLIISGVGGTPRFSLKLRAALDNKTVCADTVACILSVCREVYSPTSTTAWPSERKKPVLATISSTGISETTCDVPVAIAPMYHYSLAEPHADKRAMEHLVRREMRWGETERAIWGAVLVRPSFLTDGPALGVGRIRVGSDEKPAVGYTISRKDVGGWLFEEVVEEFGLIKMGCRVVSITH